MKKLIIFIVLTFGLLFYNQSFALTDAQTRRLDELWNSTTALTDKELQELSDLELLQYEELPRIELQKTATWRKYLQMIDIFIEKYKNNASRLFSISEKLFKIDVSKVKDTVLQNFLWYLDAKVNVALTRLEANLIATWGDTSIFEEYGFSFALKPVIYLYPETTTNVSVKLNYYGDVFASYPEIWTGWNVIAKPNWTLINKSDNKEYSYLFREWKPAKKINYDWSTWFLVKWTETREFLQEKLAKIWLEPKEYNEFIVYWYPKMMNNKYNLVHFARCEEYGKYAELDITPKPDSILRVFMVYKPIDEEIEIKPQEFEKFERQGFSVIEWGGSEEK